LATDAGNKLRRRLHLENLRQYGEGRSLLSSSPIFVIAMVSMTCGKFSNSGEESQKSSYPEG